MSVETLIARAGAGVEAVSSFARNHRLTLTLAAAIGLAACIVIAFRQLNLRISELEWLPLAQLAVLFVPLTLLHAAWGMRLLARCAGVEMSWATGYRASALAVVAEVLPLPGGAMVRAGALIQAGSKLASSTLLVTGTAILWIALAACGAGLALAAFGNPGGWAIALGGSACAVAILIWLNRLAGPGVMLMTLFHRLVGLLLIAIRLQLSFAAVRFAVDLGGTMPFAFASIAGSASALVPGGLGISELLAALIAQATPIDPGAGLLAVTFNRLIGLAASAVICSAIMLPAVLRRSRAHV